MLEEHENQETSLQDLIDLVERDDLPTNEFTIEDKDPMVILGKLNEVIAYLQTLQATINASDSKANEALQKAIQAVADATQALSVANGIDSKATQALANAIEAVSTANTALSASNTALSTANTAISTANTALSSANSAVESAENALGTAESAETKADTAITTANGAKTTAEGIDAKATTALSNSQTAVSTANTADTKATQALATANTANATASTANDTASTANDTANTALTNSSNALTASEEANTKATQALSTANNANNSATGAFSKASIAVTTANEAKATAEEALDQVVAGLGTKVYRDSQLLGTLDIKPIEDDIANNATAINNEATTRANAVQALDNAKVDKVTGMQLSTEDFTTAEKNKLAGLNNYDDTQVQADITALQTRATAIENKNTEQDTAINARALQTSLDNTNANVNNLSNTTIKKESNTTQNIKATETDVVLSLTSEANAYGTVIKFFGRNSTNYGSIGVLDESVPIFYPNDGSNYKKLSYADLSNVTYPANTKGSTTTGSGDRVIKTYISSNGKTWYRIWASGWKECGLILTGGSWGNKSTNLAGLTFSNTDYICVVTPILNNSNTGTYTTRETSVTSKTTTSITLWWDNTLTKQIYCCGY